MRKYLLGFLVWIFYRTLSLTWRVRLIEPESMQSALRDRRPFLLAHWHGDEIALIQLCRRYRIATMSSKSKDGQMMSIILRLLGAKTTEGSSSRGGAAGLKGLIRLMRKGGHTCSFAVDGPKGPIYKVKPGVFELSRLLDCPIYYCGVSVDRALYFPKAWNKTYLPKPFAKIVIQWNGPLAPMTKDQDPRDPILAKQLEDLLQGAKQQALKVIAES